MAMLENFIRGALTQKHVRMNAFQKWETTNPFKRKPIGNMKKDAINIVSPK